MAHAFRFLHLPPPVRFWAGWILGAVAVGWAFSFLWWLLLEPSTRNDDDVSELVIPLGTADAIARGEEAPFIPNSLSLGSNRELRVVNQDVVDHKVGASTVPPGGVAVITAAENSDELVCTVHPAGYIGLSLDKKPSIFTTLLPAVGLGVPFGLAFGAATLVGKRIKMDPDDDEAPATA